MKVSLKFILLFIGVFLTIGSSNAQIKAFIDYADIDQDNAVIGFSTACTTHVKVKSSITNADTSITGNLFYWYQTDSMWNVNPDWHEYVDDNPTPDFIGTTGLLDFWPFPCIQNQLRTGPVNVIIIWPSIISSAALVDSGFFLLTNVHVGNLSGIVQENGITGSTVYPNPSSGYEVIYVSSKYISMIDHINIVDALGQSVFSKEFNATDLTNGYTLPTSNLKTGIHYIQIFYKDQKIEVVKFIKN